MNILLLDPKRKAYSHNIELHTGLFRYMQGNHFILRVANHKVLEFKNQIITKNATFNEISYNKIKSLIRKYKINLIVAYNSHNFLPEDHLHMLSHLSKIKIPKVYICGDFFRYGVEPKILNQLKSGKFDAVMFRQKKSIWKETESLNPMWLPYSIPKEKYKISERYRIPKIGFVGSSIFYLPQKNEKLNKNQVQKLKNKADMRNSLYKNRIKAIEFFEKYNLISQTKLNLTPKNRQRDKLFGSKYIDFLSKHQFGLTCAGDCDFLVSKYFEIPAAGSILVCTDACGLEIFPEHLYVKYQPEKLNLALKQIKNLIDNPKEAEEMAKALQDFVFENHSHEEREKDFFKMLKEILNGSYI